MLKRRAYGPQISWFRLFLVAHSLQTSKVRGGQKTIFIDPNNEYFIFAISATQQIWVEFDIGIP